MAQEYRRKITSVSLVNYHFIWCPMYRRRVLGSPVRARLETLFQEVLSELGCEVLALEVMPDHIRLFVNCPPTLTPCQVMFRVKGRSARVLRQLPTLWTRSDFVATAGNVSSDTIRH